MRHELSLTLEWDAGHVVPADKRCWRPGHGHHWSAVIVTEQATDGALFEGASSLRRKLAEIGRTLENSDLNMQLPGLVPHTLGVATWLWDVLVMEFPLLEVRVAADGQASSIRR